MELGLTGKTFLVVGGTGVLGGALVGQLVVAGAEVVFTYNTRYAEAADLARIVKPELPFWQVNVAKSNEVHNLALALARHRLAFDGLALCAGINVPGGLYETHFQAAKAVLEVNAYGAWNVAQFLTPLVRDGGSVVLVGSSSAYTGGPVSVHYAASKAALDGLVVGLARVLGRRGVRANVVHPGYVESEMAARAGSVAQKMADGSALGRWLTPAEAMGPVLFLLSGLASAVTGQGLRADGGLLP